MRYHVTEECIGCGLCAAVCPGVFTMGDSGMAVAADQDVDAAQEDSAAEAMDGCPAAAIREI